MKPKRRTLPPSLFWIISVSTRLARADTKCYDTWGGENDDLVPCSPSNSTQPASCCSESDYCLSNGLCLSTGVSNLMTQQGCTDKDWSAPCNRICSAEPITSQQRSIRTIQPRTKPADIKTPRNHPADDVGIALLPCVNSWNGQGGVRYCCGNDAIECCQSSKWTSIPPATLLPLFSASSSPTPSPTSPTNLSPQTSTTEPNQTPLPASPSSDSSSTALKVGVGVGLGLGIPILLLLLTMSIILFRHYKRSSLSHNGGGDGRDRDDMMRERAMTPFRTVDTTARSSTVGESLHGLNRHVSGRSLGGMDEWPPAPGSSDSGGGGLGLEWGGGSPVSVGSSGGGQGGGFGGKVAGGGMVLSPVPKLQRPISPTPLAEMDGEEGDGRGSSIRKARVEQLELPLAVE